MNDQGHPVVPRHVTLKRGAYNLDGYQLIDLSTGKIKTVNDDGAEFLGLCDGHRTLGDIADVLTARHRAGSEEMRSIVRRFSALLSEEEYLALALSPTEAPPRIIPERRPYSLDQIYFAVTNECNLACTYCYNPANTASLKYETASDLVTQCAALGVLNISLTGGEPLLVPYLPALVRQIRRAGMSYSLFTNGTRLTDTLLDTILTEPPSLLCLSLDSSRDEILSTITNKELRFAPLAERITALVQNGINLRINHTLVPGYNDTLEEIENIRRDLHNLGVHHILHSEVMNYGSGTALFSKSACTLAREIGRLEDQHRRTTEVRQFASNDRITHATGDPLCGTGTFLVAILPNGDVVPCVVMQDIIAGNINEQQLGEIWGHSPVLAKYRETVRTLATSCTRCRFLPICRGGCKAKARMYSGTLVGRDRWSCAFFAGQELGPLPR